MWNSILQYKYRTDFRISFHFFNVCTHSFRQIYTVCLSLCKSRIIIDVSDVSSLDVHYYQRRERCIKTTVCGNVPFYTVCTHSFIQNENLLICLLHLVHYHHLQYQKLRISDEDYRPSVAIVLWKRQENMGMDSQKYCISHGRHLRTFLNNEK